MEREETTVKIATLLLEDSDGDVYPCVAELLNTSSLNLSKRVYAPHHYPTYTFIYYKVGTRRGLAVVRTGLKTDVYGGFPEKSLILGTHAGKGINLSMTLSTTDMVTLAEDSPTIPTLGWVRGKDYHGTHHRIRTTLLSSALCQLKAPTHILFVYLLLIHGAKVQNYL
jgi:hypothetical protein